MNLRIDTGSSFVPVEPVATGEGFARFSIDHLSASSINQWTNAPDAWVAKYILGRGRDFPFGPAAERGNAVEAAVVGALSGSDLTGATEAALAKFDARFPRGGDDVEKERDLIAPMAAAAVEELRQYGRPEFPADGQEKVVIEAKFDGWVMPVWGFLDLVFPEHGLVVDLKTTTRVPTVMSADHQLQRAIYACAKSNHSVRFLYVSAKKAEWREDGDPVEILGRAKSQIARMDAFLRACPDRDTARAIIPTGPLNFYWKGAEALRSELYGV